MSLPFCVIVRVVSRLWIRYHVQHGMFLSLNLTQGMGTLSKSEDPDEIPRSATYHQGLHSFTKAKSILIERKTINLKTKTCGIYIYTTFTNFSMKYHVMCKVYTDVGGIK